MYVLKLIVASLFLAPAFAGPLLLVLPNSQTSTLANDDSGSLAGSHPNLDTQDIWLSSQFASVGGCLSITQFAFRLKPGTGSIDATATSFSVDMSTTSFGPSTMSYLCDEPGSGLHSGVVGHWNTVEQPWLHVVSYLPFRHGFNAHHSVPVQPLERQSSN
jgi:hypothetical protein